MHSGAALGHCKQDIAPHMYARIHVYVCADYMRTPTELTCIAERRWDTASRTLRLIESLGCDLRGVFMAAQCALASQKKASKCARGKVMCMLTSVYAYGYVYVLFSGEPRGQHCTC